MKRARVVLADDHTLILEALRNLIEFEVVDIFADGLALVEGAPALAPDVIVLDVGMPNMNGLLAGRRLEELMPRVKLIYLTMNHDPDVAAEAFRLGASGFLVKNSAAAELVRAIREALKTMRHERVRRLPVVGDSGRLEGILSMNDVVLRAKAKPNGKAPGLTYADVVETYQAICAHTLQASPQQQQAATA